MVHNIYINWGNEICFIHVLGYHMTNLTYENGLNLSILMCLNTKENNINIFKKARKCIYNAAENRMA